MPDRKVTQIVRSTDFPKLTQFDKLEELGTGAGAKEWLGQIPQTGAGKWFQSSKIGTKRG